MPMHRCTILIHKFTDRKLFVMGYLMYFIHIKLTGKMYSYNIQFPHRLKVMRFRDA